MVNVRELQRRGIVRPNIEETQAEENEPETDSEGFVNLNSTSSFPQKQQEKSSSFMDFFDTGTNTSQSSNSNSYPSADQNGFSTETNGYSKKQVDEKIEELDNKIYRLEQRIELLERKAGVGRF